jgi:hypothetical protein
LRSRKDHALALSSFEKGKLKIAAHAREELERAGIGFEAIRCNSGGLHMRPGTARLSITVGGLPSHLDLSDPEVEECEAIVVGETWHKIDAFIRGLK